MYISSMVASMGVILIPLGFYLILEGKSSLVWYGQIAGLLGILCFVVAIIIALKEERKTNEERKDLQRLIDGKFSDLLKTVNTISQLVNNISRTERVRGVDNERRKHKR